MDSDEVFEVMKRDKKRDGDPDRPDPAGPIGEAVIRDIELSN